MPEFNFAAIIITLCFILLDIVSGFVKAVVNKTVDSKIMKNGLFHKCGFILAIVLGFLCEYTMNYLDLGFTVPMGNAVCIYIIATELISILENLGKISPELANSKFMDIFRHSG